ncbi:MAG TPA: hypothetical protein VFP68_20055, partial [Burkholderiaceae bacterium]|nr:hypothetical protein [Burkholderiaceae bacterium]
MPTITASTAAQETLERLLATARSGAMPLPELVETAGRLSQQGLAEGSAALYEQWIEHTPSPLRHVACFNWGTVLGTLDRSV